MAFMAKSIRGATKGEETIGGISALFGVSIAPFSDPGCPLTVGCLLLSGSGTNIDGGVDARTRTHTFRIGADRRVEVTDTFLDATAAWMRR